MKDRHLPPVSLSSPFQIGSVAIRNRVALAPMSGVTDLPFRRIAWRYGAGMVVTEMVASRELVASKGESWARLRNAGIDPHIVQLAGREAHYMAEAAKVSAGHGAHIIDINMGCPAKKVTGGYSGSALMRDPDHALSLIEATVKAVDVPVTLKMRLGWDESSINAPEIARRAEQAGVQLVTIHGRTRMQFYEGRADRDAILAVRDAISVPLIANGDVTDADDAADMLQRSGGDAVMVGRAAQGQPWIAGVMAGHEGPAAGQIADIVIEHYEAMLEFYGREAGLRHSRKHLGWYLDRFAGQVDGPQRAAIMTSTDDIQVTRYLREALEKGGDNTPARRAA